MGWKPTVRGVAMNPSIIPGGAKERVQEEASLHAMGVLEKRQERIKQRQVYSEEER